LVQKSTFEVYQKKVYQSCPKTRTGIVQNSCITLMKGFDPLQMLTTVFGAVSSDIIVEHVYEKHNVKFSAKDMCLLCRRD